MKIAIDISPIRGKHQFRGIGIYTKLLIQALKAVDSEDEYILTTKSKLSHFDLIHYPFFDLYFLTLPWFKFSPTVVTIHDTIPLIYPKEYPPGMRGKWKYQWQRRSLRGVKAVITDSDCSRQDIIRFLGMPENKVFRVYLAANPKVYCQPYTEQQKIRQTYKLNKPYFLYVGDINYNKNVPALIKAFAPVKKDFDLVLVSRALAKDIKEAKNIWALINSLDLKDNIKVITDVPDDPKLLASIYSAAYWYIQPSYYEGFGLTVLEAMQCQVPVIASSGGSLPEITGEAALKFDPLHEEELEKIIHLGLSLTKKERQHLANLGVKQAAKFTWERTAKETIAVYRKVLG